jgi:ATP-dependent Lon protease
MERRRCYVGQEVIKWSKLPLLPLRDVIIFPHMVVPLFVGREKSIAALEKAAKNGNELFLVTQKDASVYLNPEREDVYDIGTVVSIIQMLRLPDNTVKVLIEGKYRATVEEFECTDRWLHCKCEAM